MRQLRALAFLASAMFAVCAVAQMHPNMDRGFSADKVYSFTDLDAINTFNGNLILTLPIGQTYQVSPTLSYSLAAVYNSNVWDLVSDGSKGGGYWPTRRANAGMGWQLHLGRLLTAEDPESHVTNLSDWLFIAPDGSEHVLYFEFPIPPNGNDYRWVTFDSTYSHMRGSGQNAVVDMPDGRSYVFTPVDNDRVYYRLAAILDRFNNWVNVQYPTVPGYAEVWEVSDSQGRKQRLYFRDAIGTTYPQRIVDRVELTTFGGVTATWQFNYAYRFIQRAPQDTSGGGHIRVAMLKEIIQPDELGTANGPKFSFTTPGASGVDPDPYYDTSGLSTGLIRGMQVPTRGWIEWDFRDLVFPQDPDTRSLGPGYTIGVKERRHLDRKREPLGAWKYIHRWGCGGRPCAPTMWAPCSQDAPKQLVTMIQNQDQSTLVRYYHIYYHPDCWESPGVDWNNQEYGLPLTSFSRDSENRRLSWEMRTGVDVNDPGAYNLGPITSGTVLRSYYTHYHQIPAIGNPWETNRREQSSRTEFNDDKNCGSSGHDTCYKTESKFGFIDKFGLFRQESEGGNFLGTFRTEFTNYDATLLPTRDWILGTFTEQCSVEETTSRLPASVYDYNNVVPVSKCSDLTNAVTTKFKFDRTTGFLQARRTLLGSLLNKHDLLTTLERDSHGNVQFEEYYGGDVPASQELSETNAFSTPSSPKYQITHTATYNSANALVKRQSKYLGTTFYTRDEDIDPSTGLVSASRDSAEVPTTFTFDAQSRLKNVTIKTDNGTVTTGYLYVPATGSTPAFVDEITTGSQSGELATAAYEYDGLGRLKRTSRSLPNGKVSVVQVDYDGLGRRSRVSQPAEYDVHPLSDITGYWTRYSYDPFGRPTVITAPDNSTITRTYSGIRQTTRFNSVATSATGSTTAQTTETYDGDGRIVKVEEYSGDTSAADTEGGKTTTTYSSDVHGNLAYVNVGGQERKFEYDGRGFLKKETHPEATATTYEDYDARGHAQKRTAGGIPLKYEYDAAERLRFVKNSNGVALKTFDFGTANDGADKRQGKLITAIRRNELTSAGTVDVTESYEYKHTSGQISKRTTLVERVNADNTRTTLQKFEHGVNAYDDFGLPQTVSMPACLFGTCGTTSALTSITNTRKDGYLTSVDGFGTMTYHPSGMVKTVRHATPSTPTDLYDARFDMPRPSRITFQGCTNTKPYFLPGFVRAKVDPNACGTQVTWPSATLCGGASNIKYRILRNDVDITGQGCITGTKFIDRNAVRGNTYTYRIIAEGPGVDGGAGTCQGGQTEERSGKPFEFKSCDSETILTVDAVRLSVGVPARFTAFLGSTNGPLQDEELTFSVLGKVIGTARTASNGFAILDRLVDLDPRLYEKAIEVAYAGGLFAAAKAYADLEAVCDGPSYNVTPLSFNVLSSGGIFPIIVIKPRPCTWTPIPASGAFFTIDPTRQQQGTGTFRINVPDSQGAGDRASHVKVVNKFVVVQQGSGCTFRFDPSIAYVQYKSRFSTQMQVSAPATCHWSVRSNEGWLHLERSSGTGNGYIAFHADQNNGKQRVATLSLNGGEATASVNQYAPPAVKCPVLTDDLTGPGEVRNGQFISLRAHVEGTYLEYEWWINDRPTGTCEAEKCESRNVAPGGEGYPAPGQSSTFRLVVSNSCDTVVTRTITVRNLGENCRVPIITDSLFRDFAPFDAGSPFPGYEVSLSVVGLNFPNRTSFYWVEVSNNCGSNVSRTGAVFMPDPPPRRRRRAVSKDFTGDGKADLPWHNTVTGQNEIQPMSGTAPSGDPSIVLPPSAAGLQLQSIGDIDDNERPDLIFRNPQSGSNEVWPMSYTRLFPVRALETRTDGRWSIGGVADLDNDYNDDIIWHNNATGENEIWFQTGTQHAGTWKLPSNPSADWGLHGADDFNRDEKPDLFFHNRATGENAIWYMNDAERSVEIGTNSDGSTTTTTRKLTATIQPMASLEEPSWMPAMIGDMNGDGYPDIVWRNTVSGRSKVWTMIGATRQESIDLPVRTDLNWQIGGGGSTNAGNAGGGTDPRTATSIDLVVAPAPLGTAAAVTATLHSGTNAVAQRPLTYLLNGTEAVRLATDASGTATAAVSVAGLAAGTYPNAITVRFAGDTLYAGSSASATLVIETAPAEVIWSNPAPIVYGTPLGAAQLNATATVPGTFVYSLPAGTILNAGYQTLTVTFTPSDASIAPITKNAVLFVNKAPSSVTWATPASIAYGTPLSDVQLNAASSLAGSFTYDPEAGTVLPVGTARVLRVTFRPDSPNYDVSTGSTTIDVAKGTQTIRWSSPAPITFPTPLGDAQLNARVITSGTEPPGALTYTPPAGTVLTQGVHEVTVTAAATANYQSASMSADVIVNRLTAIVNWTSAEPISYGTPLSATQLNATASMPGTFAYTPGAGTVLDAGTHNLSVRFTPSAAGIEPVTITVTIRVLKVKPLVTWATPAPIVYGASMSAAQLNATANVAGTFIYEPAAGAILEGGPRELLASFRASDTRNYEAAAATVVLTVNRAPQTITWASPAAIVYGTALSSAQLNATVQVAGPAHAGALAYSPAAGTVLHAGPAQVLTMSAAGTVNYEPATKSVTVDVLKATPVLTWPQPAPIIYKTLLSSTQLNVTANIPGAFIYTPPASTLLQAGTYTLSAKFTPADTHNYNDASTTVTLEVKRAMPVISWSKLAGIVYGTPLSATQVNATADVPGIFTYTPAAGTILNAGAGQTLAVHFQPDDTRNHNDTNASTTLDVAKAKQTIVWPAPAPIPYGTPLAPTQLTGRGDVVGPSPAGALTYMPPAGTILDAGVHTLTVDAAETFNYEPATATVMLYVNRAPLALVVDAKSRLYGAVLPVLTGVLTVVQNNDPISPSYATLATQRSPTGSYPITATLLDPNHRLVNYDVTVTPSTLTVNPAPLLIAANAVSKQYSDPLPALKSTFVGLVLGETPAVLTGTLAVQTTAEPRSAPGAYPISISGLTSPNYAITYVGATVTVTPEDARVVITSPRLLSAAPEGPTTVRLTATVKDISATAEPGGDVSPGDIRKATLAFVDGTTNAVLCAAPIALVIETDERLAVGTCTFTREFGDTLPSSLTVGAKVAGFYLRDAAGDNVTLSMAAAPKDFITGEGAVEIASAAGRYAPTLKSESRFDLHLKYDKKKASFKGRFTFHFSRVVNGAVRQYELSLGSASSFSTRRTTPGGVAAFVGTAALRDVTVRSKPVVIVPAGPLLVTATDGGKPPARDYLSVMFLGEGALMVTGWDGTGAVEQLVRRAKGDQDNDDDDDDDDDEENGNITVHYKNNDDEEDD